MRVNFATPRRYQIKQGSIYENQHLPAFIDDHFGGIDGIRIFMPNIGFVRTT